MKEVVYKLMTMVSLNINTLSSVSQRTLASTASSIVSSTQKLSTGKRINRAGDDIASLSINTKINSQLRGIEKAQLNIMDNLSKLEYGYEATKASTENIQKIRELFVQGLNGTNSVDEKDAIQREINGLINTHREIAYANNYAEAGSSQRFTYLAWAGEVSLFLGQDINYQVGPNDDDIYSFDTSLTSPDYGTSLAPQIPLTSNGINTDHDGIGMVEENKLSAIKIPGATVPATYNHIDGTTTLSDNSNTDTLEHIDQILKNSSRSSDIYSSKISYLREMYNSLEERKISLSSSKSHFEDTNIGKESTKLIREQLRQESAGSMYTQANAQAQFVLNLLP